MMKNISRKKLNNKGFTLIELLAVVVILAIVMGIAATSVLTSINNSRKSSLVSTAQNLANTLNTWVSEDMVSPDAADKKLGDTFMGKGEGGSGDGKWHCLGDDKFKINNGGNIAKLSTALSLSEKDIVLNGSLPEKPYKNENNEDKSIKVGQNNNTCSAFRYNETTGAFEVLLVAAKGGKYWVSNTDNFAFSRASATGELIND